MDPLARSDSRHVPARMQKVASTGAYIDIQRAGAAKRRTALRVLAGGLR